MESTKKTKFGRWSFEFWIILSAKRIEPSIDTGNEIDKVTSSAFENKIQFDDVCNDRRHIEYDKVANANEWIIQQNWKAISLCLRLYNCCDCCVSIKRFDEIISVRSDTNKMHIDTKYTLSSRWKSSKHIKVNSMQQIDINYSNFVSFLCFVSCVSHKIVSLCVSVFRSLKRLMTYSMHI